MFNVVIQDEAGAFSVRLYKEGTLIREVRIDQEEPHEALKDIFEGMNVPVTYEEVY